MVKGLYTKEEGMQLPMVAIQTSKCKSLLKIATFSISAWAGEDWTFVALWFCVVEFWRLAFGVKGRQRIKVNQLMDPLPNTLWETR